MWPLRSGYLSGRLAIAAKLVVQYCALDPAADDSRISIDDRTRHDGVGHDRSAIERRTYDLRARCLGTADTKDWLRAESETVAAPFTVLWSRDDWPETFERPLATDPLSSLVKPETTELPQTAESPDT
jgi:hypothetical protein